MPRIAAVDYGKKRIGLAISDENRSIALPLKLVSAGKTLEESAANVLSELARFNPNLEKILVGLPLLMNGKRGEMADLAERFAALLASKTQASVECVDERLSTAQAERVLKDEMHLNRKQRGGLVDCAAAAVILQAYLDKTA